MRASALGCRRLVGAAKGIPACPTMQLQCGRYGHARRCHYVSDSQVLFKVTRLRSAPLFRDR